jgi:hypothetical protein
MALEHVSDASLTTEYINKDASSKTSSETGPEITQISETDFEEWARLFRAFIAYHRAALPDEQYEKTFRRLINPRTDLYALVLRDRKEKTRLIGLAHYFPRQTTWMEEQIMILNGESLELIPKELV